MARPPKDRPDVQIFTEIAAVDQLVTNRLERILPKHLSYAQFSVLRQFARNGGVSTPAELARSFHVTKGAMTNTLQRLSAQGFVTIETDPVDGRRKLVTVTPEGVAAHTDALAAMRPMMDSLRSAFTDAEFVDAAPFLKALRVWLEETP